RAAAGADPRGGCGESTMTDEQRPSQPDQSPVVVPVQGSAAHPEVELPSNLAILPSRDAVLYPGMLLPLQTSDAEWIRLLSDAVSARQPIGLVLQRDPSV